MEGFPGQSDWPTILKMLQSEDEMMVYQGAMELKQALTFAQDNQMHGFTTEQFMEILVKIIQRDPIMDLSNEVKYFCIGSLTKLMDIFPNLVNGLVNAGLCKGLTKSMEGSLGQIEISEACIQAFEMISKENPAAVLRSGAIAIILQQIDFFDHLTQSRIFKIIMKISRHSTSEADFDTFIMPMVPFISMNLSIEQTSDQKKLEDVSKIVAEIQESFCIFINPINDFEKVGAQFDKLLEYGIFDIILEHVKRYGEISENMQKASANKQGYSQEEQKSSLVDEMEDVQFAGSQIDSGSIQQQITHNTIMNFLKTLENATKFSIKVSNKAFSDSTLLKDLSAFLPDDCQGQKKQYNSEDFPLIMECINLLSSVISDRDGGAYSHFDKENLADKKDDDPYKKRLLVRKKFQESKRDHQVKPENRHQITVMAESLLPRIFFVIQTTINSQFRSKTLDVIDKVLSLFDNELLKNFIKPDQFANFISQIFSSKHPSSIDICLKITKKVMECSPNLYSVPIIREGVAQMISDISTEDKYKRFLGIRMDIELSSQTHDLDIDQVKEALHFSKLYNDHGARDFYERKLLELVEKQKVKQSKLKELREQKKKEASLDVKAQEQELHKPDTIKDDSQLSISLSIIQKAKELLDKYFENEVFLQQLDSESPETKQKLNIIKELTQISSDLCSEAQQIQNSMEELAKIEKLLTRVIELLTTNSEISMTSFEFKKSKLLFSLNLLLTKTPNQAIYVIQKKKLMDDGEELKNSSEIMLMEAEKKTHQILKKESRCMIYRLKLFAQLLSKTGSLSKSLIDLSHKVISDNDQILINQYGNSGMSRYDHLESRGGFGGPPPGLFGSIPQHGYHQFGHSGDYEQCMQSLKQLQKRVTINLIYDSKKTFMKTGSQKSSPVKQDPKTDKEGDQIMNKDEAEIPEVTEEDMDNEDLAPSQIVQKMKSHNPALMNIGAQSMSVTNEEIHKKQLQKSKVYMKRDYLYSELKSIPVTVEQSSCLQILEDFLRNRIRSLEQVKGLKFDYGFPGMHSYGQGGPGGIGDHPFGGSHYQSITQKILRKSLSNGARKILDSANDKLAQILNGSVYIQMKQERRLKKRAKQFKDEYDEEMSDKGSQKSDSKKSDDEDDRSQKSSDDYGEGDMEDIEAETERMIDEFIEKLSDEIIISNLPEEQQHILVKVLTRQHTFMMDQLKMNYEDRMPEIDHDNPPEDEINEIEERLQEFQSAMEGVKEKFMEKKALQRDEQARKVDQPAAVKKGELEEEEKKQPSTEDKPKDDSDQEMDDQRENKEKPKDLLKPKEDKPELGPAKIADPNAKKEDSEMLKQGENSDDIAELEQIQKVEEALMKAQEQEQNLQKKALSPAQQEVVNQDLEELIKLQGEDIEYEFYYEGKLIQPNRLIFEIIKETEQKRRQMEQVAYHHEKVRIIQEKEDALRQRVAKMADSKEEQVIAEREVLKKESDRLKELFNQLSKQFGQMHPGSYGGPPGFLSSVHGHKIHFCIKDRMDDSIGLKRLDSLHESVTIGTQRQRSKSEAVQDLTSQSINFFVQHILKQEFKVFDDQKTENDETSDQKLMFAQDKQESLTQKSVEKDELEQSLKILKVINFLQSNLNLIKRNGIQLLIQEELPVSDESENQLSLWSAKFEPTIFHHQKLDSYLQRSIKDPNSLVQGALSSHMQQIYNNCPFLFPFATKELYFKLTSFISSIDVHRAIFFLRQYIKKQGGVTKAHEKDNIRKIARQRVPVKRDELITCSFDIVKKIDKRQFLEIEFVGDTGIGLGPTLEFYDNIADEFKTWSLKVEEIKMKDHLGKVTGILDYKMWRNTQDNLLFPSPVCIREFSKESQQKIFEVYRLCGTIVAKAMTDDRQIDLPISPLFWKLCLGSQLSIFDYEKLDEKVFKQLAFLQVIANKYEELEKQNPEAEAKKQQIDALNGQIQVYCPYFYLPMDYQYIQLVQDGLEKEVTVENVQDYIDLVLHYTFHETVKVQIQGFKKGFNEIFPIQSLAPFTQSCSNEDEIENVVCGAQPDDKEFTDKEGLMKNIIPDHGYTKNSDQYMYFIRYITEMDPAFRNQFIKFLTGSKRLPIGGFKSLDPKMTFVKQDLSSQEPDSSLPSVMACLNYVKSPGYSSYEVFKMKYDYSVENGQASFALS